MKSVVGRLCRITGQATRSMQYLRVEPERTLSPYQGKRPFRAVVVVEDTVSPEWRATASKWLVESGCLYMLAWGHECSAWDDAVDYASLAISGVGDVPESHFVMTTWHEKESLSEVFWFAKTCAVNYEVEIIETLLFHVSLTDREQEYTKLFDAV